MSIKMTPFMAVYGYDAPNLVDVLLFDSKVPKAQDFIQGHQDLLKALKDNIPMAQNQQKKYADQQGIERFFEVGDMVYLRLQPYRQSSLKTSGKEKLKPKFYGPYKVLRRIGEVAYELELPSHSKIHNVFHVSCLKKALGQHVISSQELPPLDDEGKLILAPESILEVKKKKLRSRVIREYLIKCKGLPMEDSTWEGSQILSHPALNCLGSSNLRGEVL